MNLVKITTTVLMGISEDVEDDFDDVPEFFPQPLSIFLHNIGEYFPVITEDDMEHTMLVTRSGNQYQLTESYREFDEKVELAALRSHKSIIFVN